jgi:hypothetical protein
MNQLNQRKGLHIIFLLLLFPLIIYSQEGGGIFSKDIDTAYIEDYTGWLTTRAYILYQDAAFNVSTDEISNIIFKPNTNVKVGIAGFYKWFGLGLSINNPFFHFDEEEYGKTSAIDFRVNFFGRAVAAEAFLQNFRGFYITNVKPETEARYIIPDMNLFSMGAYGYWIPNSLRFSIRAAFLQNERQKKSAGSIMVRPGFTYYELSSDNGIIPPELQQRFHIRNSEMVTGGKFYSFSLAPGYSYTFIFLKNAYVNLAAFPGVSFTSYVYQTRVNEFAGQDFMFFISLRAALGYNSRKWYVGGAVITGFNDMNTYWSSSSFFFDLSQFRIWGGLRFDLFRRKRNNS